MVGRRPALKHTTALVAVLVLVAGIGAWQAASGGLSDAARARVAPGGAAVVGLISEGEDVELAAHARPRGTTVFFFTKAWCAACWRLAPRVEEAVRGAPDAALRVVDIGSWDSPVARRQGIVATPHLVLYEDGVRRASGVQDVLARLAR